MAQAARIAAQSFIGMSGNEQTRIALGPNSFVVLEQRLVGPVLRYTDLAAANETEPKDAATRLCRHRGKPIVNVWGPIGG